ncbi:MAG: O-acetyl-ADP-ribose deacetylase [candidate division WOR-3 bacterium]
MSLPNSDIWQRVVIIRGDITRTRADIIVNAANPSLLGGGGVDGAIHRAAGPELLEECRRLHACPPGEVRITRAYRLPARWIVHTVGPIWHRGDQNEAEILARCYRNSLLLAVQTGAKTIAFPAISTGAYGFPVRIAARIALTESIAFLSSGTALRQVLHVCFDEATKADFEVARSEICQSSGQRHLERPGTPSCHSDRMV